MNWQTVVPSKKTKQAPAPSVLKIVPPVKPHDQGVFDTFCDRVRRLRTQFAVARLLAEMRRAGVSYELDDDWKGLCVQASSMKKYRPGDGERLDDYVARQGRKGFLVIDGCSVREALNGTQTHVLRYICDDDDTTECMDDAEYFVSPNADFVRVHGALALFECDAVRLTVIPVRDCTTEWVSLFDSAVDKLAVSRALCIPNMYGLETVTDLSLIVHRYPRQHVRMYTDKHRTAGFLLAYLDKWERDTGERARSARAVLRVYDDSAVLSDDWNAVVNCNACDASEQASVALFLRDLSQRAARYWNGELYSSTVALMLLVDKSGLVEQGYIPEPDTDAFVYAHPITYMRLELIETLRAT